MKAVVILSGGVDSTTTLYKALIECGSVYAITFNYGQRHKKEVEYAKNTCRRLGVPHKIVDISTIKSLFKGSSLTDNIEIPEGHYEEDNMKSTVVPNRNMIFISLATAYAISVEAERVYIGVHGGDHAIYPDCRPLFIKLMDNVTDVCDYNSIELKAPYLHKEKAEIVKDGLEMNVDYSMTWTCYKGKEKACGKCGSCVERLEAFEKNNIKDPISYEEVK